MLFSNGYGDIAFVAIVTHVLKPNNFGSLVTSLSKSEVSDMLDVFSGGTLVHVMENSSDLVLLPSPSVFQMTHKWPPGEFF